VNEIPLAEWPLLALDDQDALATQDEEVLLPRFLAAAGTELAVQPA